MQLERLIVDYIDHYNEHRPHRSLDQRPPSQAPAPPIRSPADQERLHRTSRCDGLILEYRNAA
jgi:transposase InsO family protein